MARFRKRAMGNALRPRFRLYLGGVPGLAVWQRLTEKRHRRLNLADALGWAPFRLLMGFPRLKRK